LLIYCILKIANFHIFDDFGAGQRGYDFYFFIGGIFGDEMFFFFFFDKFGCGSIFFCSIFYFKLIAKIN
jgi:hypothetical protein